MNKLEAIKQRTTKKGNKVIEYIFTTHNPLKKYIVRKYNNHTYYVNESIAGVNYYPKFVKSSKYFMMNGYM